MVWKLWTCVLNVKRMFSALYNDEDGTTQRKASWDDVEKDVKSFGLSWENAQVWHRWRKAIKGGIGWQRFTLKWPLKECVCVCVCLHYRLNELEEASSLAADFWSMHRDLRSSLSEIERKLNAVDTASTHSVETMQNQLREAKVTSVVCCSWPTLTRGQICNHCSHWSVVCPSVRLLSVLWTYLEN